MKWVWAGLLPALAVAACTGDTLETGAGCIAGSVLTFQIHVLRVPRDTAAGEDFSGAVLSDTASGLNLLSSERVTVQHALPGSSDDLFVLLRAVMDPATVKSRVTALATQIANATLPLLVVRGKVPEAEVDANFSLGAKIDGVAVVLSIPCLPRDCHGHGVPSGTRPACACTCHNGWVGMDCSEPSFCAVPQNTELTEQQLYCGRADHVEEYVACEKERCVCAGTYYHQQQRGCLVNSTSNVGCATLARCYESFRSCLSHSALPAGCGYFMMQCCRAERQMVGCDPSNCDGADERGITTTELALIVSFSILGFLILVAVAAVVLAKDRSAEYRSREPSYHAGKVPPVLASDCIRSASRSPGRMGGDEGEGANVQGPPPTIPAISFTEPVVGQVVLRAAPGGGMTCFLEGRPLFAFTEVVVRDGRIRFPETSRSFLLPPNQTVLAALLGEMRDTFRAAG
eukprot:Sspe_Gene.95402::Locus_67704_Transcript_1_1_Confidence_1.000_Length_1436::g.95402::m.95402